MEALQGSQVRSAAELLRLFQEPAPGCSVEYMLFLVRARQAEVGLVNALEEVREVATQTSRRLAAQYIWQREDMQLQQRMHNGTPYLYGKTEFGDSIDDEWLIVYLLRELSAKFTDLWVRVCDGDDGEFLLIEAAEVLPRWLSPETDRHRVWIHGGELLIIPSTNTTDTSSKAISLSDALTTLRLAPASLVHSPLIEAEAFFRLQKYPAQIRDSVHHAIATIPRSVASLLHEHPQLISAALDVFAARDPLSTRRISADPEKLRFSRSDCVTVSIKFSKLMFAQLKSDLNPLPSVLAEELGMVRRGTAFGGQSGAEAEVAAWELGLKITAGFELFNARQKDEQGGDWLASQFARLQDALREADAGPLPTDEEISRWTDVNRSDDVSWMDLDINDLDAVLQGRASSTQPAKETISADPQVAIDLRKMVSRFEAFLNDKSSAMDGTELESMDNDDEDAMELEEDSSEDEDKEVSFDEEQFAQMMREMMGLPQEPQQGHAVDRKEQDVSTGADSDDDPQDIMAQTEAELRQHGVLGSRAAVGRTHSIAGSPRAHDLVESERSGDEDIDLDYSLAKNILESFKGQAGLAGPAGNIMGLMGLRLPRDEDDEHHSTGPG